MFNLQDLLRIAYIKLEKNYKCDKNNVVIQMNLSENDEPTFLINHSGEHLPTKNGEQFFKMKELFGTLKYSSLITMASAFGGLSKIINDYLKGKCEDNGIKFNTNNIKIIIRYTDFKQNQMIIADIKNNVKKVVKDE